jgi:hypothetical protein
LRDAVADRDPATSGASSPGTQLTSRPALIVRGDEMTERAKLSTADGDRYRLFEVADKCWVKIALAHDGAPDPDRKSYSTELAALKSDVPGVRVPCSKGTYHEYVETPAGGEVVEFDVDVVERLPRDLSPLSKALKNAAALVVRAKSIDAGRQLR